LNEQVLISAVDLVLVALEYCAGEILFIVLDELPEFLIGVPFDGISHELIDWKLPSDVVSLIILDDSFCILLSFLIKQVIPVYQSLEGDVGKPWVSDEKYYHLVHMITSIDLKKSKNKKKLKELI